MSALPESKWRGNFSGTARNELIEEIPMATAKAEEGKQHDAVKEKADADIKAAQEHEEQEKKAKEEKAKLFANPKIAKLLSAFRNAGNTLAQAEEIVEALVDLWTSGTKH